MMLIQDGIENARTKAELRRAVLRTAALVHWRHDFTQRLAPAHAPVRGLPAGVTTSTAPAGLFHDFSHENTNALASAKSDSFHG